MKRFHRIVFLVALVAACPFWIVATVHAMPPLQHRVTGAVQTFDPKTGALTISPTRLGQPAFFWVREGRTRLRENGQPATQRELPGSGHVKIYYKTEFGQRIATEVSWRAEKPKL